MDVSLSRSHSASSNLVPGTCKQLENTGAHQESTLQSPLEGNVLKCVLAFRLLHDTEQSIVTKGGWETCFQSIPLLWTKLLIWRHQLSPEMFQAYPKWENPLLCFSLNRSNVASCFICLHPAQSLCSRTRCPSLQPNARDGLGAVRDWRCNSLLCYYNKNVFSVQNNHYGKEVFEGNIQNLLNDDEVKENVTA